MQIRTTSYLLVLSGLASGLALSYSFNNSASPLAIGLAVLAFGLGVGPLVWQLFYLKQGFNRLEHWVATPGNSLPDCGIRELNLIASQFSESRLRDDANQPEREFEATPPTSPEFNRLLSDLESRYSVATESDDSFARLENLVSTVESKSNSGIHQAIACSREIGKSAQQLVMNADEQTDTVHRITEVIESLSGEIISLGESAEHAMDASTTAQQFAVSGLDDFEEIVKELETIKNCVSTRERKLQLLGQHSREIGSIVQSVGTLSSRTDLLALNASIESARAGEFGRGFAIVAEEVRELAEQSAQSVSDINSKVDLIQQETQESISVAFGEHEQINLLISRLHSILESMKSMSDASNSCADDVSAITAKTQQQLKMMTQVVSDLESSSKISKANRIQAEGVHWTARTLEQIGEQLGEPQLAGFGSNSG